MSDSIDKLKKRLQNSIQNFEEFINSLNANDSKKFCEMTERILEVSPNAHLVFFPTWNSLSFRHTNKLIDDFAILKFNADQQLILIFPKGNELDCSLDILDISGWHERSINLSKYPDVNFNLISRILIDAKEIADIS